VTFPEVESQPSSAVNQTRMKRQLADQAIAQATAAQWSDAAETNQRLLELGPDAEAENRLAKALWEQGELGAAQLLVLHLQLDLVHLELVQELLGRPCACTRLRGAGKLRLGLCPQLCTAPFRPFPLPAHTHSYPPGDAISIASRINWVSPVVPTMRRALTSIVH
jgi:hypothetical protein